MASIGNANKLIQSDSFAERIDQIYSKGHYETQILRYEVLLEVFSKHFGNEIDGLYSSPGRIEICGNHTDHNNGKVLCAAVNSDTIGAVKKTDTGIIRIASQGFPVVKVDIKDMTYRKEEIGTSEALVRGIIRYMVDKGRKIGSFDCATISNIYKGAGVSSSAAFECLIIRILNDLFNDNEMHPIDIAKTAQFAESKYFGKPCGLMDQAAIAIGGVSYIDFEDEHNPVIRSMNWRFDITVVLINTGGDHSNLTSHYHSIKDEMSSIAEYYGYKSLRVIKESTFYNKLPELKSIFNGRTLLRAMHFYEENKRVELAEKAIMSKDLRALMMMINQSGDSSYKKLQNCYVPGDKEQLIPFALSISKHFDGVKAVRIHGGGFAGTIIAFVEKDKAEPYVKYMSNIFGKNSASVITIRNSGATKVISL